MSHCLGIGTKFLEKKRKHNPANALLLCSVKNVWFREHLPKKKMFSFGHCPNEGGRALPELKNTLYIFLYDGRKRCTSCPKEGEGEER